METDISPSGPEAQPVSRPAHWGVDLERSRRPGVPMEGKTHQPFPNATAPVSPQQGEPSVQLIGRPVPPVFSTAMPLRGLPGALKRLAYSWPDHLPRHWILKLYADKLESAELRLKRLAVVALPAVVLALLRSTKRRRRGWW